MPSQWQLGIRINDSLFTFNHAVLVGFLTSCLRGLAVVLLHASFSLSLRVRVAEGIAKPKILPHIRKAKAMILFGIFGILT